MNKSKLGFGVAGALPLDTVEAIARRADELGLVTLWFNETHDGDALSRVAAAQAVSQHLVIGVGVINLDAKSPAQIARNLASRGVDTSRLILGIGASKKPSPLATVSGGLRALRSLLPCPVVVGSLGPKMRQLGAEQGDGLLFNWLPPEFAAETTEVLRQQAAAAGNDSPLAATYVRTALGAEAFAVLEQEAAKYTAIPSYGANFNRLGISAMDAAVSGQTAEDVRTGLAAFDGTVDHVVVRAITATDDTEHYLELLEAVAPLTATP
jgi:alkanesulfonate monooxygenase SsuD/methylene tetrahydromethanopterin reductase-like flavin-dependent oxidoreductase (luciferase family)